MMKITKTKMWIVLLTTIRKKSITRLETTVRMGTTVSTDIGIYHMKCSQDRDPCQDEDEHADDQIRRTAPNYK